MAGPFNLVLTGVQIRNGRRAAQIGRRPDTPWNSSMIVVVVVAAVSAAPVFPQAPPVVVCSVARVSGG